MGSDKTRGQLAYELAASGLKWREVAQRMGGPTTSLIANAAKRYARRHGLKWPLKRIVRRKKTIGADEIDQLVDRMRRGDSLEQIAADRGCTRQAVQALLAARVDPCVLSRIYDQRRWDRKAVTAARKAEERAQRQAAAEARRRASAARGQRAYGLVAYGLTWEQAAAQEGFGFPMGAWTAARKWADANDLPWPPALTGAREVA